MLIALLCTLLVHKILSNHTTASLKLSYNCSCVIAQDLVNQKSSRNCEPLQRHSVIALLCTTLHIIINETELNNSLQEMLTMESASIEMCTKLPLK